MGEIINYKLESRGIDDEYYDDNIPCPIDTDNHRFTGVTPITILHPLDEHNIPRNEKLEGIDLILQCRAEHENERVLVDWYLSGNR
ncbi:MAG: hypothetical protein KAR73_09960 [Spirochaetales bacterium]|nr:hypothetical protein [Spirochaetales bacterium]